MRERPLLLLSLAAGQAPRFILELSAQPVAFVCQLVYPVVTGLILPKILTAVLSVSQSGNDTSYASVFALLKLLFQISSFLSFIVLKSHDGPAVV